MDFASSIHIWLVVSAVLFCSGLTIILIKRHAIMLLLGLELMLNASNINFVLFNSLFPQSIDGQLFALFVMVIAVCETAIGLTIFFKFHQTFKRSLFEQEPTLKER